MSFINAYIDDLDAMKNEYQSRLGSKQAIEANIASLETDIKGLEDKKDRNMKLSFLLQKAAELSRDNAKQYLEEVGTMALQYVFDKDMQFVIDVQDRAGRAEADFYIQYSDGNETIKVKPEDAAGGGVVDVLSTALRFAYLEQLKDPKVQSCIKLDEPGKMISEVASHKMASFLAELKQTFNRQTIMITHNDIYGSAADKVFEVTMINAISKVVVSNGQTLQINNGTGDLADVQQDGYSI